MKNAEGFKFMAYERPNHFAGHPNAVKVGYPSHHGGKHEQPQPWSQLGTGGPSHYQKDRTKSGQMGGGNKPQAKYRPKQPFEQLAGSPQQQEAHSSRDKAKSQV
jgi:hypothetical protein